MKKKHLTTGKRAPKPKRGKPVRVQRLVSTLEPTMWGLKANINGWLLCLTKRDLIQAATSAGMDADMWEEVSAIKGLPCFVHWIYNANGDPEFVTVHVQDAKDILRHAS